jgi:hypothetical protein
MFDGVGPLKARVDRAKSYAPARRASHSNGRACDSAHVGVAGAKMGDVRYTVIEIAMPADFPTVTVAP